MTRLGLPLKGIKKTGVLIDLLFTTKEKGIKHILLGKQDVLFATLGCFLFVQHTM